MTATNTNIKTIPEDIATLRGLATSRQWEKAAYAWAFCGTGKYSFADFAALGITGFRAQHTVRAYFMKWEEAIQSGHAIPVAPGMQFTTPDLPWQMETDATRGNRVSDPDAYAAAAAEAGTTVGMAIRTGSSLPALAAAIKADPKVAQAAQAALIESLKAKHQERVDAYKKRTITDPAQPEAEQVKPKDAMSNNILLVKLDGDLKKLQDFYTGHTFADPTHQEQVLAILDQFIERLTITKSLILNGSVSDQAEEFLKAIGL